MRIQIKEYKKNKINSKELKKIIDEERQKLSIQRFKGLGEMNPDELWETTLNPDNRNLIESTIFKRDQGKIERRPKDYWNFNGR